MPDPVSDRLERAIRDVATATGLTSRALRHYEQIGLLSPSRVAPSGYRYYGVHELARIYRILSLRALDLPLADVRKALDNVKDIAAAMRTHLALLHERQDHTAAQLAAAGHAEPPTQKSRQTRTGSSRGRAAPRFIAGLIPEASGEMTSDMRAALDERKALIEHRAMTIAETETRAGEPWTESLGAAPSDEGRRRAWLKQVGIIAAYRDRYGIAGLTPLGQESHDANQRLDAERARAALQIAQRLGGASPVAATRRPADRAQQRSQPQLLR